MSLYQAVLTAFVIFSSGNAPETLGSEVNLTQACIFAVAHKDYSIQGCNERVSILGECVEDPSISTNCYRWIGLDVPNDESSYAEPMHKIVGYPSSKDYEPLHLNQTDTLAP